MTLRTLTAAALLVAVSSFAQTPTPAQGRYYAGNLYKVIAVDADGKLIISNPGGSSACTTVMLPCYVVGVDADGAARTGNPIGVAGIDGSTVRQLKVNQQGLYIIGPTANGAIADAAANPVLVGIASSGGRARTWFAPDAVLDASTGQNVAAVQGYLFNGSTYDRIRSAAGSLDNATGIGTLRVAPALLNNSGNYDREFVCDQQADIELTAATDAVIVAAGGGTTRTRICHIDWSMDTGQIARIREGTGANCGTGTNNLTGPMQSALTLAMDYTNMAALRNQSNNVDTCIHFDSAVTGGGVVIYAQF